MCVLRSYALVICTHSYRYINRRKTHAINMGFPFFLLDFYFKTWPRQESNLNLELRKLLYYPLYYEAGKN